jgi:hypothetical protein
MIETMIWRLPAWASALMFAVAMLAFWSAGWRRGRRLPPESSSDPGTKYTDASMALLGLLLAFTFSMSLGRHDIRRQAAVAESNAIGDFSTCASLLKEPTRSKLGAVVRDYARHNLDMTRIPAAGLEYDAAVQRCQDLQARMTEIVAEAIADGTPIANPLTNTLNNLTSAKAAHVAANQERLPWLILALLLLGAVVPALLMGLHQGASKQLHRPGTFSFMVLVTLVIYVILDLNQPKRGLITVSYGSLEQQLKSMEK